MVHKLIRTVVLAVGVIGLLGTATPAQATTEAAATFTGTATTSPIGYPCTPPGSNCPPAVPGPTFGYQFSSTVCVGVKADINKPSKHGADAHGPNCAIQAAGTATGYCGLSKSNTGTATISYSGPLGTTKSITVEVLFITLLNIIVFIGTGEKTPGGPFSGTLEGIGQITPVVQVGGGSCTNGTQTQMILSGYVSYTEVT